MFPRGCLSACLHHYRLVCLYSLPHSRTSYAQVCGVCLCSGLLLQYVITPPTSSLPNTVQRFREGAKTFLFSVTLVFSSYPVYWAWHWPLNWCNDLLPAKSGILKSGCVYCIYFDVRMAHTYWKVWNWCSKRRHTCIGLRNNFEHQSLVLWMCFFSPLTIWGETETNVKKWFREQEGGVGLKTFFFSKVKAESVRNGLKFNTYCRNSPPHYRERLLLSWNFCLG